MPVRAPWISLLRSPVARVLTLVWVATLAVVGLVLTQVDSAPADPCGGHPLLRVAGGPLACAHEDEAPPGVDPTEPVSTAELLARDGGGAGAWQAAQELGVPSPLTPAANAATPDVTCEGDGSSGYRTQAMYVVEAGRTNRYATLLPSLQLWAAGVDDVVNRSAALTGGVRRLRWVTDTDGTTCKARVLNVTVPAGATSSFSTLISAVQALGHTNPARKYLMWTDATVLCGVASMYPNDNETQANPNNGSYAQYARVDSGCWGWGNGSSQHSVEAHEILHTLGGVQSTAPHGTRAGHCWDESDTMCYADGGGFAMQQVCAPEREYLFDCNNDDYFTTYADPGSYLDSHWNAADSRFLIGGGDGSGGGSAGTPTVLGATIAVNNPAVPGLSTQVSVAPSLPPGRTITSVAWKSARADCVFSTPTQLQSLVTCGATASATTSVTVTLVDSTGATKSVASPLTFATGTARPVTLSVGAAGQSGAQVSVCTGAAFPVTGRIVDVASGQPVKGLTTTWTKRTAAMTAPANIGAAVTDVTGTGTLAQTASVVTTYAARTAAGTVYAAATPASFDAVPAQCTVALTAAADASAVYYADPVTLTGTLTRSVSGATVPVGGATLTARLTTVVSGVTRVTTLATARTAADGSYRVVVKPTTSGTLSVALPGTTAYVAATAEAGAVAVTVPDTRLTGAVNRTDVGYGSSVTVSGTLQRVAGPDVTPLASRAVSFVVAPAVGTPVRIGGATTNASGAFSAAVPLRATGTLSVVYAGAAGQPAATVVVGPVVAGTWTPTVTATASAGAVPAGTAMTLTGTVTRAYQGVTEPGASVRVSVFFQATGSATKTLMTTATAGTTGAYTARIYPRATGTWTVQVYRLAGYADASSPGRVVTVS